MAYRSIAEGRKHFLQLVLPARHHHVDPGLEAQGGLGLPFLDVAPVGHDEAVVAPLPAEQVFDEPRVIADVGPVEEVIGSHESGRMRFFDDPPESLQVDFPKGPLVDFRGILFPVVFPVVAAEMLDAGSLVPLAFDPADDGRSHFGREERVFAKVLEVPPAKGIADDVHRRGEPDVLPVVAHFLGHRFADPEKKVLVPAGGQ